MTTRDTDKQQDSLGNISIFDTLYCTYPKINKKSSRMPLGNTVTLLCRGKGVITVYSYPMVSD